MMTKLPDNMLKKSYNQIDVDTLEQVATDDDDQTDEDHVVAIKLDIEDVLLPPETSSNKRAQSLDDLMEMASKRKARLHWEDVRLCIKKGKDDKVTILDSVWGESPQGEISAIMGPSGSG
jgi:ABC-type glutathione transport system ATPase component